MKKIKQPKTISIQSHERIVNQEYEKGFELGVEAGKKRVREEILEVLGIDEILSERVCC